MIDIINEITEQLKRETRKKEYFYVTDIGKCKRKICLDFKGAPKKDLTTGEMFMFDDADESHKNLAKRVGMIKGIAVIENEMNITEGLPSMWHGRLDSLCFDIPAKEFFVIDFKGTRAFRKGVDLPKQDHIYQIKSYLFALRNMGIKAEKGLLFYKDRTGSCAPMIFEVDYDPEIINVFKEYEDVYEIFNATNELPEILPREFKLKRNEIKLVPNWQCSYCKYQGISCKPIMSENKVADVQGSELIINNKNQHLKEELIAWWKINNPNNEQNNFLLMEDI